MDQSGGEILQFILLLFFCFKYGNNKIISSEYNDFVTIIGRMNFFKCEYRFFQQFKV